MQQKTLDSVGIKKFKRIWDLCTAYLLYKRLDNGKLQWPKDEIEVRSLSQQEVRWLLEGLSLQQPKAIAHSKKGVF